MSRRVLALVTTVVLAGGVLALAPGAEAALPLTTYRVNTTGDPAPADDSVLSLREALLASTTDETPSRIVLAIGGPTYQLTRCGVGADLGAIHATDGGELGEPLTIEGRGATIEQTCTGVAVLRVSAYSPLTLRDLTITGGEDSAVQVATGWGISTYDVRFVDNSAIVGNGGAVRTTGGAGGVFVRTTFADNTASAGGALWANGSVIVRNSTFSGNGGSGTSQGGAIQATGEVNLRDSTFSGNVADSGAALHVPSAIVSHTTIAGDTAEAGAVITSTGSALIAASIVQPAAGSACSLASAGTSGGYNRAPAGNGCGIGPQPGDLLAAVALGPLAGNGGPTQTRLPLAAGPGTVTVIDAIDAETCAQRGSDQRYVEAPQGEGCEIGAVEVPSPFSDVGPGNPFFAEISWMDDEGITTGYDDGTFRPAAGVSRAAMAAFLYRLSGDEGTYVPPTTASFPDVPTAHPFFEDVEWLIDEEITGGYGDGTFRPAAPVSRQAMAAFVYRYEGEPDFEDPASPSFSDVGTAHPFFTEVEWMADEGISAGYVDGTWRPGANVSRQAMSRFLFVNEDVGTFS